MARKVQCLSVYENWVERIFSENKANHISDADMLVYNNLVASFQYRNDDIDDDDDDDDLINDQWYETFSVEAEEKIYDDLCSVASSKVDWW